MKKIFLDIGSYMGNVAKIVLNRNEFDIIHCFEPSSINFKKIKKHNKIIKHNFGLYDQTCKLPLYYSGRIGGSVFKEKKQPNIKNPKTEICNFVRASEWFKETYQLMILLLLK